MPGAREFAGHPSIPGAIMHPILSVDSTFEHALFLRLFLTGGGGW